MTDSNYDLECDLSLKATAPLSLYSCTPHYNLRKLHEYLKLQPLEKNWHDVSVGNEEITYCSIMHNTLPYISFTLKMFEGTLFPKQKT